MILLYGAPIIVGAGSGMLYGCSFLLQQRGIFFGMTQQPSRLPQLLFFLARFVLLCGIGYYLLRSPVIPSILGLIAFLSVFWCVILVIRAQTYERI